MPHAVTLIPGDGTGPEITEATRRVLEATGVQFAWHMCQAGAEMLEKYGTVLPDEVIESIKQTLCGIEGAGYDTCWQRSTERKCGFAQEA